MKILGLVLLSACRHALIDFPGKGGEDEGDDSGTVDTAPIDSGGGDTAVPEAALQVSPDPLEIGEVTEWCERTRSLQIENRGSGLVSVEALDFTAGSAELSFDPKTDVYGALPWDLAPGDSVEVSATYAPTDLISDTASLVVRSDDPVAPEITTTISGTPLAPTEVMDSFVAPEELPVDVIFAVDTSASMLDRLDALIEGVDHLTTGLNLAGVDYRIAMVADDTGCILSSDLYIDPTFTAEEVLSAVGAMLGDAVDSYLDGERAFTLLTDAYEESQPGGCNAGLVRSGSRLHLVGVSDEPEQSAHDYSYYVSYFESEHGTPDLVWFDAIGGDYPTGCGSASAYVGLYEATVATGGTFLSICDDEDANYEQLADGIVAAPWAAVGKLSEKPIVESLGVRFDGVNQAAGWAYDEDDNRVVFTTSGAPDPGVVVEISYAVNKGC